MITGRNFLDMFKDFALLELEEDKVYVSQQDEALPHYRALFMMPSTKHLLGTRRVG
jgi:hypothetical protein